MAEGRLPRRLIKSGAPTATPEFVRTAEEVIADERAKNHHLLATDLERLLHAAPRAAAQRSDVPRDKERGFPLLDVREPRRGLGDLVLADDTLSVLEEVLLENNQLPALAAHGLQPTSRLLFAGPPGCGKTTAAEALAFELGLPFAVVRIDAVVSSLLGETAANLRRVFEYLEGHRLVVLFDELDALGRERGQEGEHGELRRLVNAFLQMMDAHHGRSLLVAATNHESLLDRAVWRRFEEVVLFDMPSVDQQRRLLDRLLRAVRHDLPLEKRTFTARLAGLSHADLERVVLRAWRTMALKGTELLTEPLFDGALAREERRQSLMRRGRNERS